MSTIVLSPVSAFTYNNCISDALIDLKGTSKAAYTTAMMNKLCVDAVLICRKVIAQDNPEMIQTSKVIYLVEDNSGPYSIAANMETPLKLLDEYQREIGSSYRGEYDTSTRKTKPDGYWIEGHAPSNIYLNAKPNQAYTWTMYYIESMDRETDMTQYVPLPRFCREPITALLVKLAGMVQESETMDEDAQIRFMFNQLDRILSARRPAMELKISGVGF